MTSSGAESSYPRPSPIVETLVRTNVYQGYVPLVLLVPDTLVSSVRPRKNILVPGTGLLKYPGSGTGTRSCTVPDPLVSWYDIHTRTRSFGKFGTTYIPVPNTLITSVRPRQNTLVPGTALLKYKGLGTGTDTSGRTRPDALVSLVQHPYPYPTFW